MPASILNSPAYQKGVWGNAPLVERGFDQSLAAMLDEQYQSYDATATTGDYVATAATSGTAAVSTAFPGALILDAGATTANQGMQVQRAKSAYLPAAGKSIWFEALIQLTATTPPVTRAQLFVGLAELDTTIFASGSQTTANHIGWRINTGGLLVTTFACNKATVEATRTGPTLVAATDIRLGFRYDGSADTITQYVNGVATGTAVATASVPKVVLYPSLACLSDGTDRPNLIVKGVRVLQLR
jgi:hypothetical protein